MADIRSKMVDILIEREGLSREAAGTRADELMEQGVEKEIVDDQFAIYEDWMDNYQSHPMLGHRWTPDEANCVIIEMMRVNGIYETDRLVKGATAGGMTEHDALALVMPVAGCVDLGALVLEDMADAGLQQDPACSLSASRDIPVVARPARRGSPAATTSPQSGSSTRSDPAGVVATGVNRVTWPTATGTPSRPLPERAHGAWPSRPSQPKSSATHPTPPPRWQ